MKKEIKSYKDLIVWQKSLELVIEIYNLTKKFPKEEQYSLTSQMQRCAISIPSNISEGRGRGTKKDFAQFLKIARGSANELETQLEISKRLSYANKEDIFSISKQLNEIMKMLNVMVKKLKANI